MTTPLNNLINDMNSTSTDLQAQFTLIKNQTPPANTNNGAQTVQMKAVADWQRILNDSATIKATVNLDVNLIQTAAFAELKEGDNIDALLLFFGSMFGINATKVLTDTVTQANNIVNNPTLQNIVNTNLSAVSPWIDSTTPISQVTVTPSL